MGKLIFRYGTMNSGKRTLLLQVAKNYEEKGKSVKIIKPIVNMPNEEVIFSRIGITRDIDYLVTKNDNLKSFLMNAYNEKISCILVDEAHFLNNEQVDELYLFSKKRDVTVICHGLRTDFKTNVFSGSLRLFEIADIIEEVPTICECGKKAKINARKINNEFVTTGEQIVIEGGGDTDYESLCGKCYLEKVLHMDLDEEE